MMSSFLPEEFEFGPSSPYPFDCCRTLRPSHTTSVYTEIIYEDVPTIAIAAGGRLALVLVLIYWEMMHRPLTSLSKRTHPLLSPPGHESCHIYTGFVFCFERHISTD
ncbi:unnamed protein product [Boreogadus saida]